jgi:hypothetical protein
MAYKIMGDSNIDYGQALKYIPEYLKQYQGTRLPKEEPRPGRYIVSIQQMVPYNALHPHAYSWLLHFKPVDEYKVSLLIFNIRKEDIANAGLNRKMINSR